MGAQKTKATRTKPAARRSVKLIRSAAQASAATANPNGKPLNRSLHAAKSSKQDEFYTQLPDIEKELRHYKAHFKGKTVFCNCDDPRISHFFRHFLNSFEQLGLKRLITTSYRNEQPDLFSTNRSEKGVYFDYTGEQKGTRLPDPVKIKPLKLKGNGDFRSAECVALLKQSDIVVTNPPFSLFREYVEQLVEHDKKFLIIGNSNALHYQEIFKLLKENMMWLGYSQPVAFVVPDHYEMRSVRSWRDENGTNWRSLGNARWFTNLDILKRHEDLILINKYDPKQYPKYDNFDAIEVSRNTEIPYDYKGLMGVPDTFLDRHNPDQFELVGIPFGNLGKALGVTKNHRGRTDIAITRDGKPRCPYSRIIVKRKS